jgi:hypothetical protein
LRELADASESANVREFVFRSFNELGIPQPGDVPPGFVVLTGGKVVGRSGSDSFRLEVAPLSGRKSVGFQVRVLINDVERTSAGAGFGIDPYEVLVPTNRLVATTQPRTVPIARCGACGVYDCVGTDVTIVRDDDLVHWDWSGDIPMKRGASFAAAWYDTELERVAADLSWETPERIGGTTHPDEPGPRTAARLRPPTH